jgi:hypothetical protein
MNELLGSKLNSNNFKAHLPFFVIGGFIAMAVMAVFLVNNVPGNLLAQAQGITKLPNVLLRGNQRVDIDCDGRGLSVIRRSIRGITANCVAGNNPAPSTMPTARPSNMPMPTGMPTSMPTAVPSMGMPTATPIPSGNVSFNGFGYDNITSGRAGLEVGIDLVKFNQMKAAVAANPDSYAPCPTHDPTKWHPLVDPVRNCRYDHHHGDDPSYVNDIFGEAGAWFGKPGQSISYPWQTFVIPPDQGRMFVNTNPAEQENSYKHEGYAWVVRRNQDCPTKQPSSSNPFLTAMGACVTDFRVQYHFHGMMDIPVRFHSTSAEMRLCINKSDPSSCGIYRTGGWIDMGRLFTTAPGTVSCAHNVNEIFIPISGETRFGPFQRTDARDEIRCHPNITSLSNFPRQGTAMSEWWGHITSENELRYQIKFYDAMGNVSQSNPNSFTLFCKQSDPNCRFTHSMTSLFMGYVEHLRGSDVNGKRVTYINRWGQRASGCSSASVDCIPQTLENVKMNLDYNKDGRAEEGRYFHTQCGDSCTKVDHNISPNGRQWLTWFYKQMPM